MGRVLYRLCSGLSPQQVEEIHDAALGLIQEVGLKVPHVGVRGILADHDGVRLEGERVHFRSDLVEKAVQANLYPAPVIGEEWGIISGAYELNVTDLDTGEVRPPTTEDLIALTKLADSYGMYGSAPVRPLDIPSAELQEVAIYRYSWEYSARRSDGIFDANEKSTLRSAQYIYEMAQVAGKEFSLGLWEISPFGMPWDLLDILYHFRGKGIRMWVATMPIAGVTAPIFLPGAYVQSVAELLAGLTLVYLLNTGGPVQALIIDSIRAYPFDMQVGNFVYGSPEDLIATLFQVQLNARYGIPLVAKSLLTTAKEPDAHAAAEKGMHTLAAALAGARIFTNAGLLAVDEIYSAEQVVIDHEIVQYVRRVVEGIEYTPETLALETIREGGPRSNFLEHETTVRHCRTAFWLPTLFEHSNLASWRERRIGTVCERARTIARQRITSHEYRLPDPARSELERIYRKAAREILGL
ncbi:MAG: trimethylamine methyltransferase family protein [Anaerolineae bacterium]